MSELLNCPFCPPDEDHVQWRMWPSRGKMVRCDEHTEFMPVEEWNRRAPVTSERKDEQRDARDCTCHPDDNPPRPCPQKFAYSECVAADRKGGLVMKDEGLVERLENWPRYCTRDGVTISRTLVTALCKEAAALKEVRERALEEAARVVDDLAVPDRMPPWRCAPGYEYFTKAAKSIRVLKSISAGEKHPVDMAVVTSEQKAEHPGPGES